MFELLAKARRLTANDGTQGADGLDVLGLARPGTACGGRTQPRRGRRIVSDTAIS
jgi:hypothetical protein